MAHHRLLSHSGIRPSVTKPKRTLPAVGFAFIPGYTRRSPKDALVAIERDHMANDVNLLRVRVALGFLQLLFAAPALCNILPRVLVLFELLQPSPHRMQPNRHRDDGRPREQKGGSIC